MLDLPPELADLELPQYRLPMIPKEAVELPWKTDEEWEKWVSRPIWKRNAFTADKDHLNSVLMSKPLGSLLSMAYFKSVRYHVHRNGLSYLASYTGPHRCLVAGSKVLMADGSWKNIEEIKYGDAVISPQHDGSTCFSKVIATHTHFEEEVYNVVEAKLTEKTLYSCSKDHKIPLIGEFRGRIKGVRQKKIRVYKELTAQHISKLKEAEKSRVVTFSTPAVDFKRIDSSINPYCLGVWLGDGHCAISMGKTKKRSIPSAAYNFGVTTNDEEIIEAFRNSYPNEVTSLSKKNGTTTVNIRLTTNTMIDRYPKGRFFLELKRLNLIGTKSGTKFIPKECMLSSIEFRRKLLAGLIDTDGHVNKQCTVSITTKSELMANDILDLIFSLGGAGRIRKIIAKIKSINFVGEYFQIEFAFKSDSILALANEVKVKRKKERLLSHIVRYANTNSKHKNYDPRNTSIKCVRAMPQQVYGFTIDSPSSLFITNRWLVTHNSAKSVTACLSAHLWDPTFWPAFEQRVIQSPYQFATTMNNIIEDEVIGAAVVVDEAGTTFSSGDWYEKWMKVIHKFLQTCGMLKPIILFVAPNREFIVSGMRKLIIAEHHMKKFNPKFVRMSCYHVKYNFMRKGDPYIFKRPLIRIAGQNITLKSINLYEPPLWFVQRYKDLTEPDKKDRMKKWTEEVHKVIAGQEDEGEPDYDSIIEDIWSKKELFFGRRTREGVQTVDQTNIEVQYSIKPKFAKMIKDRIERRLAEHQAEQAEMAATAQEKQTRKALEDQERRKREMKTMPVDELAPPKTEERKEQKEKMSKELEDMLSSLDD